MVLDLVLMYDLQELIFLHSKIEGIEMSLLWPLPPL